MEHSTAPEAPAEILEYLVSTAEAARLLGYRTPRVIYEQLRRGTCPIVPWRFRVATRVHLRWDRRELCGLLER